MVNRIKTDFKIIDFNHSFDTYFYSSTLIYVFIFFVLFEPIFFFFNYIW